MAQRSILRLISFFLIGISSVYGQSKEIFSIENDMMVIKLERNYSKLQTESICGLYSLPSFSIDSLFTHKKLGKLATEGWKLRSVDANLCVLERPLEDMDNTKEWSKSAVLVALGINSTFGKEGTPGYPSEVVYGRNKFGQKVTVRQRVAGYALFWLPENKNAKKVYLSGNFNDWSLYGNPMQRTDSGWVLQVKLDPGKYFYKFIVDGNWTEDRYNALKEDDGHDGYNSTYYQTNFTFNLKGYKDARKVVIAGSFNNWDENELKMLPTPDGWIANLFLQDGLHTYKFIVDGNWINDPANKRVRADGEGNFNSVVGTGDTVSFSLMKYKDAHQVILSGNFNNWRTAELAMEKTPNGWNIDYMLPPGNYEYKFIVDGNWITDPYNPFVVGGSDQQNSLRVVKPNYIFKLKKYPNAKEVFVSGTFNNWASPGYKMYFQKEKGEWVFPLHLKPGKYLYKFVVDGKWMIDPGNSNWEENEFDTGNSVLWMESKVMPK